MKITLTATELPAWDFAIRSFDGWTLEIVAGQDSSLAENAAFALRFSGVCYIDCPANFSHASIRLATRQEKSRISKRQAIDDDQFAYAIDAESMGAIEVQTFYIVADSVECVKESEQIAGVELEKLAGARLPVPQR